MTQVRFFSNHLKNVIIDHDNHQSYFMYAKEMPNLHTHTQQTLVFHLGL